MTEVVFETATLVDAVKKACRVAPTKGEAYDKASGVVIEVRPDEEFPVVVRATNLQVYYMQWVSVLSADGAPCTWRFHAQTLDAVMSSLPLGAGKQVKLATLKNRVQITQARIKAVLNVNISTDYPIWNAFDPEGLVEVQNLGGTLAKVEWAAADTAEILGGVRFNGTDIVSTDRYKVGKMDFPVELDQEFVIRARTLTPALPPTQNIKLGFDGTMMLLMPDDSTQMKVLAMAEEYVRVETVMVRSQPNSVRIRRQSLIAMINRALSVKGADRTPMVKIYLGRGEVAAMVQNDEMGLLGDVIEVPGYCDHPRIEMKFSPENIIPALENAPGEDVTIHYNAGNQYKPIRIEGAQTYEAWVAGRGRESD